MKKNLFAIAVLAVVATLFIPNVFPALADGMMIESGPRETTWDRWTGQVIDSGSMSVGQVVDENSQEAYIAWDEKEQKEKMLILVDKGGRNLYDHAPGQRSMPPEPADYRTGNDLFWIIPVKSRCEDVKPNHFDKFSKTVEMLPLEDESKNRLKKERDVIFGLQIWPLLSKLVDYRGAGFVVEKGLDITGATGDSMSNNFSRDEVKLFKHIESFGVDTQILSAESLNALEGYLDKNGILLDWDQKKVIEEYISSDFCFAVSKVVSHDDKDKLGIMLEFKPDKPFYPMYITSAYGQKKIKVQLISDNGYRAKMGKRDLPSTHIYLKDDLTYGKDEEILFKKNTILTKTEMFEYASNFTADIIFEKSFSTGLYTFILLNLWAVMILILVLLSLALGILIFKESWIKAGVLNAFGILGLLAGYLIPPHFFEFRLKASSEEKNAGRKGFAGLIFLLNTIMIFIPILFFLFIFISINTGGFLAFIDISDLIDNEMVVTALMACSFLSLFVIFSSLIVKKIIIAPGVESPTKKLLAELIGYFSNLFQLFIFIFFIVGLLSAGPKGWIALLITLGTLIWFVGFGHKSDEYSKIAFIALPVVLIAYLVVHFAIAIVSAMAVIPYMINYYLSHNVEKLSAELAVAPVKDTVGTQKAGLRHPQIYKILLFSVLFILAYVAIDELIKWLAFG